MSDLIGAALEQYVITCVKRKRRTNISTQVIDNNLSFLESVFIFSYRLFFEPFIHETNKRVYAAHANGGFLIA